jgi:putative membrane protein
LEPGGFGLRHLINWILSALAVWVVAQFVHGFHVQDVRAALIAALVIGLVNATLGAFLKILTLPLTVLTLGVFWLVINALMLELASAILSPAFHVDSFLTAFWGAIILSLVNMLFRWLAGTNRKKA